MSDPADIAADADGVTARAWNPTPPRRRPGPKASLSLGDILDTGIALGDAEGVAAISLGRTAATLGVTTNALYRYLDSRDELLVLLHDRALGGPTVRLPEDWPTAVRAWAVALRARYDRHPWLADVPVRVPFTPNALSWLDVLLRALEPSGLDDSRRLRAAALLDTYVRSSAATTADLRATQPIEPPRNLTALLAARGLSAVAGLLSSGAYVPTPGATGQADFDFGLDCVVTGLRHLADSIRRE